MSLTVAIHTYDDNYTISSEEIPLQSDTNNDLAGLESWRTEVYSHDSVKTLGCTLLPQLAEEDLFVFQEDLAALRTECNTILAEITTIAHQTHYTAESIRFRIQNILHAIDIASQAKNRMIIIQ